LWRVYENVVFFNLERPHYHKEDNAIPCFGADRRRDAWQRGAISDTRYQNGQAQSSGVKYFYHGACQRVRREGFLDEVMIFDGQNIA
jgi:hypothetical protein